MESQAGNKDANFTTIEAFVAQAAAQAVDFVIFPECCITGYWFIRHLTERQLGNLAESIPDGVSLQRLKALAAQYAIGIGAGLVEKSERGFYNSYVVALPDGTTHRHRKIQAFEHPLIQSGTEYTVFDTPQGWHVGILICYDNNVNENGRMTALLGADIILAPHQTGGCRTKNPHLMGLIDRQLWDNRHVDPQAIEREFLGDKGRGWLMRWLPSRAHDNGVFLIFANGVGVDDDEIRTGNAMVIDPYGRILTETWAAADAMVVCDLDPALLEHATGREWIAARRPEMYELLTQHTGLERDTRELKFNE
ncbi:MAG: acyltransferase [Anaerolineae bacterium]|nr:acyltransferase [Anaerolineae bacterium]